MEQLNRQLNKRDTKIRAVGFAAGYEAAKTDLATALQNIVWSGTIKIDNKQC
jgi:hypothetical protein